MNSYAGRLSIAKLKALSAPKFGLPYYMILLYFLFEYGRPQDFIPALKVGRPGMIIQLGLIACLVYKNKILDWRKVQTKLFVALLVFMTLHVPFAVNNYWAFQTWRNMVLTFIVFMSMISFIDTFPKLEHFVNMYILINIICAVVGAKGGGKIEYSYFMGDENDFALSMNIAMPFAFFMLMAAGSSWKRFIFLMGVAAFVTACAVTFSRGGFVGLLAVSGFCWFKMPNKLVSSAIIGLLVLGFLVVAPAAYWQRIDTIKTQNIDAGTGAARWFYWTMAWKMFESHPLFGVGQGNFPWNITFYERNDSFDNRLHGGRVAHSLYMTLLSELGITGTLIYFGMLYRSYRDLQSTLRLEKRISVVSDRFKVLQDTARRLRKVKFITLGIIGAMIGCLISGTFLSVLYYPHMWVLFALSIVVANMGRRIVQEGMMAYQISTQVAAQARPAASTAEV